MKLLLEKKLRRDIISCFASVQVILILLFILIEVSRIFSGWKGNLTENVGKSQFMALAINKSISNLSGF